MHQMCAHEIFHSVCKHCSGPYLRLCTGLLEALPWLLRLDWPALRTRAMLGRERTVRPAAWKDLSEPVCCNSGQAPLQRVPNRNASAQAVPCRTADVSALGRDC